MRPDRFPGRGSGRAFFLRPYKEPVKEAVKKVVYASVFAPGTLDFFSGVTIIKPYESAAAPAGLRRGELMERRDAR